ncbi:MAG: acyltransferase family protein [Microcoleaceae cyanobacterium]
MAKLRLLGIDLIRSIAAYAVVLLHADEGISQPPDGWATILKLSGFAVPFFLAASFYLSTAKLHAAVSPYRIKPRLSRLLIPYGFWTVMYILYKVAKYSVDNEPERITALLSDPIPLIFFGSAAFHLYFLPLLSVGTVLLKPIEKLLQKTSNINILTVFFILSTLIYELILASGNSFQSAEGVAFQSLIGSVFPGANGNPIIRVGLVALYAVCRCLPYIFLALILSHPRIPGMFQKRTKFYAWVWLLLFLGVVLLGQGILPKSIYELASGYLALLLAIALSAHLHPSAILTSLGQCSFGIYLTHLFVVDIFYILSSRLFPQLIAQPSVVVLLSIATLVYLISWGATILFLKHKPVSRLMFGV